MRSHLPRKARRVIRSLETVGHAAAYFLFVCRIAGVADRDSKFGRRANHPARPFLKGERGAHGYFGQEVCPKSR